MIFFKFFSLFFVSRNFEDSLKILEKKPHLLNHSTLALILKSLKMVPLSLPWNSRIFEVKEIFPLKFLSYPQPWKPSKCFVKPTLDLELTLNFEDKVKDPWTSRLQLPSLVHILFKGYRDLVTHLNETHLLLRNLIEISFDWIVKLESISILGFWAILFQNCL